MYTCTYICIYIHNRGTLKGHWPNATFIPHEDGQSPALLPGCSWNLPKAPLDLLWIAPSSPGASRQPPDLTTTPARTPKNFVLKKAP